MTNGYRSYINFRSFFGCVVGLLSEEQPEKGCLGTKVLGRPPINKDATSSSWH